MRSPFLPLGLWIGAAVLSGILIGLVLWGIIALPPRSTATNKRRPFFANRAASNRSQPRASPRPRSASSSSDWDDAPASDWQSETDWGSSGPGYRRRSSADFFGEDAEDEYYDEEDPRDFADSEDAADSFYSFSYRDPEFAAQDSQTESVFDAEYRVLTPPIHPATTVRMS